MNIPAPGIVSLTVVLPNFLDVTFSDLVITATTYEIDDPTVVLSPTDQNIGSGLAGPIS